MPHTEVEKNTVKKMENVLESLTRELRGIRTGRASAALLEGIKAEVYGSMMPLNQLGNINVPQSRLIEIKVWDVTAVPAIEKAIVAANIGLNPSNEGTVIRLQVPSLTSERRELLVKKIHEIIEDFKIEIRNIRRDANNNLKKLKNDSEISEDQSFRSTDKIQKLTDEYIKKIEEHLHKKEKEIRED